jgi:hypothetical protein
MPTPERNEAAETGACFLGFLGGKAVCQKIIGDSHALVERRVTGHSAVSNGPLKWADRLLWIEVAVGAPHAEIAFRKTPDPLRVKTLAAHRRFPLWALWSGACLQHNRRAAVRQG